MQNFTIRSKEMDNIKMTNHHYKRINLLIILIFALQLVSCQKNNDKMSNKEEESNGKMIDEPTGIWPTNRDKNGDYYYTTSLNSFPGYITQDAGSHFITSKEEVGFLVMENGGGWPYVTGWGRNDEYHPIPEKLYVAWYSPHEDKFYQGTFVMPSDKIKKELDKMWRAYPTKSLYTADHFDRYKDLIVGVVPGGGVVVWLSSLSQTIEIGRYKAAVTDKITWKDFARMNGMASDNTKENYLKYTEKGISPLPFNILEKYERRYNWKIKIEDKETKQVIQPLKFNTYFYNGEEEMQYALYKEEYGIASRPVPKKIIFRFKVDENIVYGTGFTFNEDDIFKAFDVVGVNKDKAIELVIQLDKDLELKKVMVKSEDKQYILDVPLPKMGKSKLDLKITPLKN